MSQRIDARVLSAALFACIAFLLGPALAEAFGWQGLAAMGREWLGTLCHQQDNRSLHIGGHALTVCARCTGIYAGIVLGVALAPIVARTHISRPWMLAFAGLPLLVDVSLAALDLQHSGLVTRALTGLCLGTGGCALACTLPPRRQTWQLAVQLAGVALIAVPLWACASRAKKEPAQPKPPAASMAQPTVARPAGCTRDTDCKGDRVCTNGQCVDKPAPVIIQVAGCTKDTDCKGNRVCVSGECREPQGTRVVEVVTREPAGCESCPARCTEHKKKCNAGSIQDCYEAGACLCECRLQHGGCGSTLDELRTCVSQNRAKARGQ